MTNFVLFKNIFAKKIKNSPENGNVLVVTTFYTKLQI